MANLSKLCMRCMQEKGEGLACPHCGYVEKAQELPLLPLRTILQDRYLVGEMCSSNGEGVSYIGWDSVLNSPVVIRELLPLSLVTRGADLIVHPLEGRESAFSEIARDFTELSRSLARVRDVPALIPLYDIFEANGTAYSVSEKVEGRTLEKWLRDCGGKIAWVDARPLMMPLLAAVIGLHAQGVLHLAIHPQNIIVDQRGRFRLDGFSVRAAHMQQPLIPAETTDGFSAFEQYAKGSTVGTWTDVYGLCATLFYMLSGIVPLPAPKRANNEKLLVPASLVGKIPSKVAAAMANGMRFDYAARIRTVEDLRDELSVSENISGVLREAQNEDNDKKPKKQSSLDRLSQNRGVFVALLVMIAVLVIACFALLMMLWNSNPINRSEASEITESSAVSALEESSLPEESSSEPEEDPLLTKKAPDLQGQNYISISNRNQFPYVDIVLAGEEFNDEIAAGTIIRQEPEPFTPIQDGGEVKVYISKGSYEQPLEDVRSMDVVDALLLLCPRYNCVVVEQASDSVQDGRILSTNPRQNTVLEYGAEVFLYVSDYREPDEE